MQKLTTSLLTLVCACWLPAQAQFASTDTSTEPGSCTSLLVGRKASKDGSVMTSHTCDGNYRTWVDIVKGTDLGHDTTANVYQGRMHTDFAGSTDKVRLKGTVPQKGKTFNFVNTAYPCLNEKQLGMGETTISGRKELVNPNGMFYIEELETLALQNCSTARQAISFMGDLIEKYGYADSGECLTIADPKEVWLFEVFGEGPDKIGGVWAAQRVPDDHVAVSANIPRISKLDLNDRDHYMASKNVYDVARKMGFWDGKEPFRFWKAYSGGNYFGEPKSFSIREYFLLNKLAPSLNLSYDAEELPFSVKPERQLSVNDISTLLTETYEGTEWDPIGKLKVTQKAPGSDKTDTITAPAANPWMARETSRMLNAIQPGVAGTNRTVSVPQCAYSTVIQLRDWLPDDIGGVVWFSVDNPAQSPRIPIFAGGTELPAPFKICGQHRYDEKGIVWPFRRANKLATLRWGATKGDHQKAFNYFQQKGESELPFVEARYNEILEKEGRDAARQYLNDYTADFAGAAIQRWNDLGDKYWNMFGRGY